MPEADTSGAYAFAPAFDYDDAAAEHVLLEGDTVEHVVESSPGRVVRELDIVDRARRIVTSLELYDNGRLRLVRQARGKPGAAQTLDLAYLDPEPAVERRFARRMGRAALGCAGLAGLATLLAALGVPAVATVPAAVIAASGALATLLLFVHLSRERAVFLTHHGRAPALTLTVTLGSFGAQRKALPVLRAAIAQARATVGDETHVYLKREMHEHYRLRNEGVLSPSDCADGTARVLARFDAVS